MGPARSAELRHVLNPNTLGAYLPCHLQFFLNDLGTILKECGSTLVARAATTIETGEADRFDLLEICRHIGCSGAPSYLCGSLIAMANAFAHHEGENVSG